MAKKIEMLNDQQEVVHPLTSSDCVIMENGKTLEEVMGDGIATPTVTHEGASFQVGVGDSNIEVVDGDVAGMTLEGQTYQNILPKPTTLIMETDEKEFKINDKIDNNIVLDDNIAEIATVKGQTYVNVVQEESATEYTVLGEELSGQSITTSGKPEGYVKNATLEGLTLVNTIQEPSGADATVLELDADIEAQYATIDNTVQGGIHGTKLVGQTLVNVDSYYDKTDKYFFQNNIDSISDDGYIQLTANGTWRNSFTKFNNMLKPNTQYLAIVEIKTNTLADGTYPFRLFTDGEYNGNITTPFISQAINIQNGVTGVFKYILTTRDDLSTCSINSRHYISNTVTSGIIVFRYIIIEYQEGMENWDIPFFRGMQSVEAPSVKTTGKNLFDGVLAQGYIGDETGQSNTSIAGVHSPNYMKVKPNTRYTRTISGNYPSNIATRVYFYDINKTYLQSYVNGSTFITPENAQYMRFRYFVDSGSITPNDFSGSNIQFEEGSTGTTYEPYKSSTLTTGKLPLTSDMIEQGSFYDSFELNTQTYEYIKVPSTADDFYVDRIRSKGTFKVHGGDKYIFNFNTNYAITLGFCKNGLYSAKNGSWITNGTTITIPRDCNEMFFAIKKTSGANISPSEFSSVGLEIRHLVNLRKVGDVQDELDLETGELTQRIEEVVLNGSEYWEFHYQNNTNTIAFRTPVTGNLANATVMCDKFVNVLDESDTEHCFMGTSNFALFINRSRLSSVDSTGLKQYLSQNPLTLQYQLATESIKTVDLSIVDQDNNSIKSIQTHPTLTHVSTSSQGLIPNIVIPSQLKYPTIIKPSTQYTLKLKRDVVDSANQLTVNVGGVSTSVTSNVMTITTPSALTSQDIVFTGKNNVVSQLQLIEGDVTGIDYPYFEGMSDVKSPKLFTTGKNLLHVGYGTNTASYGGITVNFDANAQTFTVNGTSTYDNICFSISKFSKMMLKGKRYALSMHLVSGTTDKISFRMNDVNWAYTLGNTFISTDTSKQVALTFEKDIKYIDASIRIDKNKTFNNAVFKMMLEEVASGSATSYEPYKGVTIEQDIDSIPLTSSMFEQNGFKNENNIKGMSLQQYPLNVTTTRLRAKTLIKVKPNTRYLLKNKPDTFYRGWCLTFDKNGNYTGLNINNLTDFTTNYDVYYIAPVLNYEDNSDITPSSLDSLNLTLQEVPQEIVLRSLPNGVKDTLNLTTGEYVQRIGEVVFDGSDDENWFIHEEEQDNYINKRFRTDYLRGKILYFDGGTICNIICDKVQCYPNLTWKDDREGIEHDSFYVSFRKNCETVTKFKQCLSQDPITIQYQLITPIITKVNLTNTTKLPSYNSITHYDTILPSNSLIPNIKLPSTIDYNVAIKPSTQYTVRCNTTNALSIDLGGSTGTLANGKVTLTTPSTLAHNSLKLGNGKAKEVMVIEGSEIKDNVPFFNGMKNVQMGGIKLVNIARHKRQSSAITANTNKTQFTYTSNGANAYHAIYFDSSLLKTNTVYTVFADIITNTSDNVQPVKFQFGNASGDILDVTRGFVGKIKQTITSANTTKDGLAIVFRPCSSGGQVVIQNLMIIEGDWTHLDEIPFIESEMIIEQPIIRSQGKNLFDDIVTYGAIDGSNGIIGSSSTRHLTVNPLKLLKNVSYTFKINSNNNCMMRELYFYNNQSCNNKTYIGRAGHKETNITYTPSQDCYVRVVILKEANSQEVRVEKGDYTLQIEKSSTATSYEPFKQHTLSSNRVIGYEENCYYANGGGFKLTNTGVNSMLADVEGLSIAYVVGGSSNFTFWDKDNVFISGKAFLDTALSSYDKNGFIQVPSNAKYMRFASGNETTSNAYKTATVTGELPLRSLPNGVCDTLNLVTGEYVQRVGEVVLDGSSDEAWTRNNDDASSSCFYSWKLKDNGYKLNGEVSCDYFKELEADRFWLKSNVGIFSKNGNKAFYLVVTKDMLSAYGNSISNYLLQNPITVQFELETPIVRKIGLTAKGNYKEVELNGSERVGQNPELSKKFHVYDLNLANDGQQFTLFTNKEQFTVTNSAANYTVYKYKNGVDLVMIINENINTVDLFKRWLSQNPIKVSYLTNNSASLYSNIQKPIFFNNINVQFMNNNIDIQPSLTLQARSKNSYVMDMMKANTRYTLKALKNANSFTIDGTSYGVGTNGTFTSPSTLTNKLLITGQDIQELMIIEGDVTGLTIPYYKGIRSAYDSANRVEMLSQTRNLFNYKLHKSMEFDGINFVMLDAVWEKNNVEYKLKPNTKYTLRLKTNNRASWIHIGIDGANESTNIGGFANGWTKTFTTNPTGKITIGIHANTNDNIGHTLSEIQLEEGTVATPYQPHQHNTTSLPMPTRLETVDVVRPIMEIGRIASEDGQNVDATNAKRSKDYIPVEPDMILMFMNGSSARAENVYLYGINKNYISAVYTNGTGDLIIPEDCYFIRIHSGINNTSDIKVVKQQYKPIALNSLPNGVKDEIIIDPVSNKAKLIQRVGKVVFDGQDVWGTYTVHDNNVRIQTTLSNCVNRDTASQVYSVCDKLPSVPWNYSWLQDYNLITVNVTNVHLQLADTSLTKQQMLDWLKQNPLTVYYELATPIIHEIHLTGFPFVYEDGSVQLNTELPHTTKVKYNVNQEHLINGQNETIIRHDKQIDNLYDYIELYLEEEYRMELFRMQLELSL